MKNKKLILGAVVCAIVIIGFVLIRNHGISKSQVDKAGVKEKSGKAGAKVVKAPPAAAIKKTFAKEMGGLTVKMKGPDGKDLHVRVSAFKSSGNRSSVYAASLGTNRMQELPAGTYDLQVETVPSMIYKGVAVSKGKETVEDLGSVIGSLNVKMLGPKKNGAYVSFRVTYPGSSSVAVSGTTNRPVGLLPGTYDIDINTMPKTIKKGVKITAGKENVIDLGNPTGTILIKAIGDDGKEARLNAKIKKADNDENVAATVTNRPIELLKGAYTVELGSSPPQVKKDVAVEAGAESVVDFAVTAQAPQPAKK